MNKVTVQKSVLIGRLKENKAKHRDIFLEALEGWRQEAIRILEKSVDDAKRNKIRNISINLPRPEDHTREYDRALEMLEMEVGDEVTISREDFTQLVQDDWSWKRQFLASTRTYSARAAREVGERGGDDDLG